MPAIILTLCSDLCAASGSGNAHTIDTDICFDSYGIPYYPARRLKGCLREAAEYIYPDDPDLLNAVFGVSGSGQSGALKIGNGQLEHYGELAAELESLPAEERPDQETVLRLFTTVRGQTAVSPETGTARKESLRYIRVMNRYLPYMENGQRQAGRFVFPVECDAAYADSMKEICKALRHVGHGRNRGLGTVRCEYDPADLADRPAIEPIPLQDGNAELRLHIRLDNPVVFSSDGADSLTYIPGSSMLGALAGMYLREFGELTGETEKAFSALFLEGRVVFSNLYIESASGWTGMPAPAWLRRMKVGMNDPVKEDGPDLPDGALTTVFAKTRRGEGKPLRNCFAVCDPAGTRLAPLKVRQETVYHHVRREKRMLYTQNALSAGQIFGGTIRGPEKEIRCLADLLSRYPLRLGRSRTAQYSGCSVRSSSEPEASPGLLHLRAGDTLVADLASDVILSDGQGANVTSLSALLGQICPGLADTRPDAGSSLAYRQIRGYNAKRNLFNMPVTAFAMGGSIIITVPEEITLPSIMLVGDRTAEGFGVIRCSTKEQIGSMTLLSEPPESIPVKDKILSIRLTAALTADRAGSAAVQKGIDLEKTCGKADGMTKSFIGRAILMCEQSETREDMEKRIASVSDKQKKEALNGLYEKAKGDDEWRTVMITALRLMKYHSGKEDQQA